MHSSRHIAGDVTPRWRRGTAPFCCSVPRWSEYWEERVVRHRRPPTSVLTSTSGQRTFRADTASLSGSPANSATSTADRSATELPSQVQIPLDGPDQTLSGTRVSDKVSWVRSGSVQITLDGLDKTLSLVRSGRVVSKFHYTDPTRPDQTHGPLGSPTSPRVDFVWS